MKIFYDSYHILAYRLRSVMVCMASIALLVSDHHYVHCVTDSHNRSHSRNSLSGGNLSRRQTPISSVWPHPAAIEQEADFFAINSENFHILIEFDTNSIRSRTCDILSAAAERYSERFFAQDCAVRKRATDDLDDLDDLGDDQNVDKRKGSEKKNTKRHLRPQLRHLFRHRSENIAGVLRNVTVRVRSNECEQWPHDRMNETYRIVVDRVTGAKILSESIWGALRGLETFSQLLTHIGENEFALHVGTIEDEPRFAHRGLLIDSARHFLPLTAIFDTLDAMEMNKLNVLHWHIVDDESFPFVSRTFPALSDFGSYDPVNHVYRERDIERVLEYARMRAIRVVVEFDTPGHTRSWGLGQPGLLAECRDANDEPTGSFGPIDPTRDSTYTFMKKFFTEVADRFPDRYLHLGGDEVNFACWASNSEIRQFMAENDIAAGDYARLESYYVQKLVNIVKELRKSYIVWQEVFDHNVTLKADTVVNVWIGNDTEETWKRELDRVTTAGYRAILSAPWYLDIISYGQDWRKYYEVEPLEFGSSSTGPSSSAQQDLVIGGEAAIWAEFVNGANLITRTFPRANAIAERLWSPAAHRKAKVAETRFHDQACRMLQRGLPVHPNDGPGWCECDFVA